MNQKKVMNNVEKTPKEADRVSTGMSGRGRSLSVPTVKICTGGDSIFSESDS